jgi:phosphatidate cytidylyltransferase
MFIAALSVALLGFDEFVKALRMKGYNLFRSVGFVLVFLLFIFVYFYNSTSSYGTTFVLTYAFLVAVFLYYLLNYNKHTFLDAALTYFGLIYTALPFSMMISLRSMQHGEIALWAALILSWASDTMAYFIGVSIGKHRLCPHISPKKSVEGSIGGLAGSAVAGIIISVLWKSLRLNLIEGFLLGIFIGFASQTGDLVASAIKRYSGIKDFGSLIPGHGGVLDRFDSIIFSLPIIYFYMIMFIS